jgi:hypothetical protein
MDAVALMNSGMIDNPKDALEAAVIGAIDNPMEANVAKQILERVEMPADLYLDALVSNVREVERDGFLSGRPEEDDNA